MTEQQPLRNTMRRVEDREFEFEPPPDGRHIFALVKVKNDTVKFKEKEKDGFAFVFRMRDNPSSFLTHKVSAAFSKRSSLFKTLRNMSDYTLRDDADPQDAFDLMQSFVGGWFYIVCEGRDWESPEGEVFRFVRVTDNQITPVPGSDTWPSPHEHFGSTPKKREVSRGAPYGEESERAMQRADAQAQEVIGGFEGYPDVEEAPRPAKQKTQAPKQNDDLPDWLK